MKKQVVVIGGGASGLMAAIFAAESGAGVTLLERNKKLGKKLLATGNGKCNITNTDQDLSHYRGMHPEFVRAVFQQFDMAKTLQFFTRIGIYVKNRNGYLYPSSEQASSVLQVLEMELAQLHVKRKLTEEVVSVKPQNPGFVVQTATWEYPCDCVVLSAGSKASAIAGSDGSGYVLAEQLGHRIIPPLPGLVPLKVKGNYFSKWAGVRVEGSVSLWVGDTILRIERGELQLTDYGISGIPVLQISRYAVRLLEEKQTVWVKLDFMPDFTDEGLLEFMEQRRSDCSYKNNGQLLIGLFPEKLIAVLAADPSLSLSAICDRIKNFSIELISAHSFEQAQICSGGVDTLEIDENTMESKIHRGLYFAGEILDVDGACGGYNLQWAWSSGAIAGKSSAVCKIEKRNL